MDTALPQKFPFILDRNLAKANCTGNRVCTSCDTVVLGLGKLCPMGCHTEWRSLVSKITFEGRWLRVDGKKGGEGNHRRCLVEVQGREEAVAGPVELTQIASYFTERIPGSKYFIFKYFILFLNILFYF